MAENRYWFRSGLRISLPIGLGYFAVALALGISASRAGMTPLQATLTSLLMNASAGEYAAFSAIAAGATYIESALVVAVANMRYLLMSCALSQKLPEHTSMTRRLVTGFFITDEIFGASVSVPDKLDFRFTLGLIAIAIPCWSLGTLVGVVLGDVLPLRVVSALSVGLYGMFVAIFIPPAKKDRVVLGLIILGFALSYLVNTLPVFAVISSSMRVIILTVILSLGAAILFPVKEEGVQDDAK